MQSPQSSSKFITIKKVMVYLTIVFFGFSLFYATENVFISPVESQGLDFRYLWIAGKVWWSGQSPYNLSIYLDEYEKYFGFQADGGWFYPPAIAPICMLLSIIPFTLSEFAWRCLNYVSLLGIVLVSWLYIRDFQLKPHQRPYWQDIRLWIGASYSLLMQSTLVVFTLGQTSIVATLGLVLLLYGCLKNYLILGIIGGYILCLKPTLAIIPIIAFLLNRKYWIICGSFGLTAIASCFAFIYGGFWPTIQGFLTNTFSLHSNIRVNQPSDLTGIVQLLNYFLNLEIPAKLLIFIAIIWAIGCGMTIQYYSDHNLTPPVIDLDRNSGNFKAYSLSLSIILMNLGTMLIMPMHTYDFVVFIPLMIYSLYLKLRHLIWLLPGWLIICRSDNVARLTDIYHPEGTPHFPGSLIISLFTVFLVAVSIWGLLDSQKNPLGKSIDP